VMDDARTSITALKISADKAIPAIRTLIIYSCRSNEYATGAGLFPSGRGRTQPRQTSITLGL
jgi:hypothetical protein